MHPAIAPHQEGSVVIFSIEELLKLQEFMTSSNFLFDCFYMLHKASVLNDALKNSPEKANVN